MRIYLTRHGQTVWNTEGRMQGWQNSDLTENGIMNAKMLGESLKDIDIQHIYSSPLGRALDTSKYIRGNRSIEITTDDRLKEMGFGIWEGMKQEEVEKLYGKERADFWERPQLYKPVDGESYQNLMKRVKEVLNYILKRDEYESILIVTHTVVIKMIYLIVKGDSLDKLWDLPYIHDTCLTILEADKNGIRIIVEADMSHTKE